MNDRLSYRVHADLLSQVADSAHEDAEVRRILSEPLTPWESPSLPNPPLTERELDARNAEHTGAVERAIRACHGPCDQGRKPCNTPDACQLPERRPMQAGDLVRVVAMFLVGWAAIALALTAIGVTL